MTSGRSGAQRAPIVPVPPGSPFPLENLPFGVFRPRGGGPARVGTAIGEHVLDVTALEETGLLAPAVGREARLFGAPRLNEFMAAGRTVWRRVRARIAELLSGESSELEQSEALRDRLLFRQSEVEMLSPAEIGDYTDFYSSKHHASNVGTMFRGPENALMPNYLHLPVAYHGRASSIVVSGTPVRRPRGQTLPPGAESPVFGPSRMVDYELELGFFVGPGNALGEPIPIERAAEHIFGFVLVNDWSARDIQKWEYQPLGPFLSKNFATSISPWVVMLEALEPFRCEPPPQDPKPLPYLTAGEPWSLDIALEVSLGTASLDGPHRLSLGNYRDMYWTPAQQLAHHTIGGCNLRPGDLLASGTISGPEKTSRGCLLELTWRGTEPVTLPDGTTRTLLEDGDTAIMTGPREREGLRTRFGECSGT
ncbi:MAG: fumarylacetoacetase, partial [Acidobacteria bacterium]